MWVMLCTVAAFGAGPKYKKPEVPVSQSWQAPPPWREATPKDSIPKGEWWTLFDDSELNQYEQNALANNQTLKAGIARLAEARSFAQITASGLYPSLNAGISAQRERLSGNRPLLGATSATTPVTQNVFQK